MKDELSFGLPEKKHHIQNKKFMLLPGFEPGLRDSESLVLTITLQKLRLQGASMAVFYEFHSFWRVVTLLLVDFVSALFYHSLSVFFSFIFSSYLAFYSVRLSF